MWSEWTKCSNRMVGPGIWYSLKPGTSICIQWSYDLHLPNQGPKFEEYPADPEGLTLICPVRGTYYRWTIVDPSPNTTVGFIDGVTKDGQPLDYVLSVDPDKDEAIIAEVYWMPIEKRGQPIPDPDSSYGYKTLTVKGNIQKSQTTTKSQSSPASSGGIWGGANPKCDMCGQYHPGYMDCYMC